MLYSAHAANYTYTTLHMLIHMISHSGCEMCDICASYVTVQSKQCVICDAGAVCDTRVILLQSLILCDILHMIYATSVLFMVYDIINVLYVIHVLCYIA